MNKIFLYNKNLNKTITFNQGGAFVLSQYDFGKVEASRSTTQFISLIGQNVDSSVIGVRDVTFQGAIVTDNEKAFAEAKGLLDDVVNPLHSLELHYGKYILNVMADSSPVYSVEKGTKSANYNQFSITLTAYYPLWKEYNSTTYTDSKKVPQPVFPLVIPKNQGKYIGYIPAFSVRMPKNDGDVDTGFILKITALADGIVNPKIIQESTGEYIEVIKNMLKGDVIEISTVSGDKYAKLIRGTTETDIIDSVTNASTFSLYLKPGVNELTITNSSNNITQMEASIEYSPSYMGVV